MDKLKTVEKKQYDTKNPLYEKNISMTGSRDPDIVKYLADVGAKITGCVTKKTSLLIKKDDYYTSSSVDAAEKANIPVITVQKFKETFMQ